MVSWRSPPHTHTHTLAAPARMPGRLPPTRRQICQRWSERINVKQFLFTITRDGTEHPSSASPMFSAAAGGGESAGAFSDDGSGVIARSVEAGVGARPARPAAELETHYEIARCCKIIIARGVNDIGLQFPDSMIPDAVPVATILGERTGKSIYILGDTSYGSCCVDEVAAEHACVDLVIHYGKSCLSEASRLPVIYVFGQRAMDLAKCEVPHFQIICMLLTRISQPYTTPTRFV